MPKYFKAATNIVGVPQKMVFVDKKGEPHLLPSLTKNKHIASHYGQSAVLTDYNAKPGNLIKVSKGEYTKYNDKVKKSQQAKLVKNEKKAAAKLAEKEKKIAEKEMKKAEREKKKADRLAVKADRLAVKAEKDKLKAEKMVMKKTKGKTDLVTKLNAVVMANDMYNDLLPGALASLPKRGRGRPKKKVQ
jgi:membrane protein involved in colicin uptake